MSRMKSHSDRLTASMNIVSTSRQLLFSGKRKKRRSIPFYFIVPAAAFYLFVVIWPSLQGAAFAFTNWDGLSQEKTFVGIKQFVRLFSDAQATGAVFNTLLLAAAITVIQNAIGLLLALGVHTKIKSRNLLRVFLFAPAVITPVAAAYLWQYLLAPRGVINEILQNIGLGFMKQDWLGNSSIAIWSIVAVVVWEFSGYSMVIFLAGLQGVPQEVIEASMVDGAGSFRRFWSVIRPELAPAFTINLMLSVIGGLKLFDQVQVTTGGGPGHATETMSTLIFKNVFQYNDFGFGIAMALVLTVFVAIISGFQYYGLTRQGK
jgi:raffinose/stachyose/melibiose transport system permease protein